MTWALEITMSKLARDRKSDLKTLNSFRDMHMNIGWIAASFITYYSCFNNWHIVY